MIVIVVESNLKLKYCIIENKLLEVINVWRYEFGQKKNKECHHKISEESGYRQKHVCVQINHQKVYRPM